MNTQSIVTVSNEVVVEVTNVETFARETLKRFMQAKQAAAYTESVVENLKPQVETARVLLGSPKKIRVNGRFHNTKGSFGITHVEMTQRFASVKGMDALLAAGVISQEQFDSVVTEGSSEYNLVTFATKEA